MDDSDNVVRFPLNTNLKEFNDAVTLPIEKVAEGLVKNEVKEAFVVGLLEDDELYMAGNIVGLAKIVYLLERAKIELLTKEMVQNV